STGSRARCQSSTCSRPSRTCSTTASVTWAGRVVVDSRRGFRSIGENYPKMTTATVTVPARHFEQVLREGGLSRFHKKAILVTGAAWTFVAMEILLVGFVAPIFTAKWGLDGRMQGLVNSAALAGSLCGSLALGRLADRIGRGAVLPDLHLVYA